MITFNGRAFPGTAPLVVGKDERVRLRFINAAAMTLLDVRIPGLKMTVVATDGQPVVPVTVDEFRIGKALLDKGWCSSIGSS